MEKGDIAVISYTARDKTTGKVFDSTIEEKAKEAGVFEKNTPYKPITVILGNKELLPALDEEIQKMKAGEEKKISLKAEKAFGERKSDLIKVLPMKEFIARDVRPVPGLIIEMNEMRGKVQSVSGGRVRVDFNHELAGKEVEYEVKVEKIVTERKEKLEALKEKFFLGTDAKIKEEKGELEVKFSLILPEPRLKGAFVQTIYSAFKDVKKIRFVEELVKQEEKQPFLEKKLEQKTEYKKETKKEKKNGKEEKQSEKEAETEEDSEKAEEE